MREIDITEVKQTIIELSEFYYNELKKQGKTSLIQTMRELNLSFMESTNDSLQRTLSNLSIKEIAMFTKHLQKYSNAIDALDSIETENTDKKIFSKAITDIKEIYNNYQNRFESQANSMDPIERKKYIESILVPHMMLILYFKKNIEK